MREIEVDILPNAQLDQAEAVIEAACTTEGLRLTMKDAQVLSRLCPLAL